MGWHEDHIKAVAQRRADNLIIHGEEHERRTLKESLYWNETDIEQIIKREKEIQKRGKNL